MNNFFKTKCDNCKEELKIEKYIIETGTFCSWKCAGLYEKKIKMNNYCIVCADCDVVKENEQLKESLELQVKLTAIGLRKQIELREIIKDIFYINKKDLYTYQAILIDDNYCYKQIIKDILEEK